MLSGTPDLAILRTCLFGGRSLTSGHSHGCPGSECAEESGWRRVTQRLPPLPQQWQQQIILSCLGWGGGQWSHRRAGGGQGRRALDKGPHSPRVPPPPPRAAPLKVLVFVPAPGLGSTGTCVRGPAPPLGCVSQHLSGPLVLPPANSHSDNSAHCELFSTPAPPPAGTHRTELAPGVPRQGPGQGKARNARPAREPRAIWTAAPESLPLPAAAPPPPAPSHSPRLSPTSGLHRTAPESLNSSPGPQGLICIWYFLPKIPHCSRFPLRRDSEPGARLPPPGFPRQLTMMGRGRRRRRLRRH